MQGLISIIIPVYNGARYIRPCYESLRNQSIQEWEAVFIDDGSTDDSLNELKKLSNNDNRVKVIHKVNEGVAIARETGIKEASGEYITFLDVDDTIVPFALEHFLFNFNSESTDIVIAGINIVSEQNRLLRRIQYRQMSCSGRTGVENMCTGALRWQLWGKAFKTAILQDVLTPNGLRSAEDMAVCLQTTLRARKINVLSQCLYNYVQVSTSVTHSKAREISYDALEAARFVDNAIGSEIDHVYMDCLYLLIISSGLRAGISVKDKIFKRAIKKHGKLRSILRLPFPKAINVGLYKYFNINLARHL